MALCGALAFGACSSPSDSPNANATTTATGGGDGGGQAGPNPWETRHDWAAEDIALCPSQVESDDALVNLLSQLSLDMSVGIPVSQYSLFGFEPETDPARLPYFHTLQQDIARVPCTAGNFALRADAASESNYPLASQIANAAAGLALTVQAGGPWPATDSESPLWTALDQMFQQSDMQWDADATKQALAPLPLAIRSAVAKWLVAAQEARQMRDNALLAMAAGGDLELIYSRSRFSMITGPKAGLNPDSDFDLGLLAPQANHAQTLYSGGVRLAQAIDETDLS